MEHYQFGEWGKYNSLCPCMDCRKVFKSHVGKALKETTNEKHKEIIAHAYAFEKAYFGELRFNGIY